MLENKDRMPVSDRLDQVVKEKLDILRREHRVRRIRTAAAGLGAAAACFMGFLAVGAANPAWASQLPIIGHIFEQMGEKLNYPGDYSEKGSETDTYTKAADGLTVTLSEVYSNGQALNIALVLQSEEPFADTQQDQDGKPVIACRTTETYSFRSEADRSLVYLDGEFTDEHTFAGVMRFDLNLKAEDYGEEEVPERFSMALDIDQIVGYLADPQVRDIGMSQEELAAMSDEEFLSFMEKLDEEDPTWTQFPNSHENYWFDGPWEFELEVSQDTEDCVTVEVGVNEDGVGVDRITATPYEITVYPVDPRSEEEIAQSGFSYFPVLLDADGMLMSSQGSGAVNTVAVGDHDVSQVEVYLFEDVKWLDEVKGFWWNNEEQLQKGATLEDGRTFRELCDETCVFHKTVTIPAR